MSIKKVIGNRPGPAFGYYNEDSQDHGERYHAAEKALRVRPKWKTVLGLSLALLALTSMSVFIITASVARWSGWFDLPSMSQITEYWGWDYNGDYEAVSKQDIVNTILSYIPDWVPHAYGQRAYFNASLTLDGEIDTELKLITGPGTCKSIIYNDPPAQFIVGEVLNESVNVDAYQRTYYYEPGALLAGEEFFFHISELENPEHYACTQTVNAQGKQMEYVEAILPSEVDDFDVWKHEHGGTVMLDYEIEKAIPKEFQ